MHFRFSFEELSLLSQNGFNLRLEANGYAVIEFEEDGEWTVEEIWLEGTRLTNAQYGYERKYLQLPITSRAWGPIFISVVGRHSQDIQDRVREELASLNISIPDPNREHLEVSAS